jgi:hypothetical protein
MQTGWFKEVRLKSFDSHAVRALLTSRAMLVKIKLRGCWRVAHAGAEMVGAQGVGHASSQA